MTRSKARVNGPSNGPRIALFGIADLRASWISLRNRPTSAAVAIKPFPFETVFGRPSLAISPRSCAASYSSARRRFARTAVY